MRGSLVEELLKQILDKLDGMATDIKDLKQGQQSLEEGQAEAAARPRRLDRMVQSVGIRPARDHQSPRWT